MGEFISPVLLVGYVMAGVISIMTVPVIFGMIKVLIIDIQDFREWRRSPGKGKIFNH